MVSTSASIRIDRPAETVFDYLDDPHNHAEITPSLVDVRNVEPLENGGKRVDHTYTMAGIELAGTLEQRRHEPNSRMVFALSGDLTGEIEIAVEDLGDQTEVTYSAEYELPGRVVSRVAAPFVKRYNARELETTLKNLKTRLEVSNGADDDESG